MFSQWNSSVQCDSRCLVLVVQWRDHCTGRPSVHVTDHEIHANQSAPITPFIVRFGCVCIQNSCVWTNSRTIGGRDAPSRLAAILSLILLIALASSILDVAFLDATWPSSPHVGRSCVEKFQRGKSFSSSKNEIVKRVYSGLELPTLRVKARILATTPPNRC